MSASCSARSLPLYPAALDGKRCDGAPRAVPSRRCQVSLGAPSGAWTRVVVAALGGYPPGDSWGRARGSLSCRRRALSGGRRWRFCWLFAERWEGPTRNGPLRPQDMHAGDDRSRRRPQPQKARRAQGFPPAPVSRRPAHAAQRFPLRRALLAEVASPVSPRLLPPLIALTRTTQTTPHGRRPIAWRARLDLSRDELAPVTFGPRGPPHGCTSALKRHVRLPCPLASRPGFSPQRISRSEERLPSLGVSRPSDDIACRSDHPRSVACSGLLPPRRFSRPRGFVPPARLRPSFMPLPPVGFLRLFGRAQAGFPASITPGTAVSPPGFILSSLASLVCARTRRFGKLLSWALMK